MRSEDMGDHPETLPEPAFDDFPATLFLEEIQRQCKMGANAVMNVRLAASRRPPNHTDVFRHAGTAANAAAMISKILWPLPRRQKEHESKDEFAARARFTELRGRELRRMLHVSENSVLNNPQVRHGVEHFDERLDRRLMTPERIIVRSTIGGRQAVRIDSEEGEQFYLHRYDPATTEYEILEDRIVLADVRQAMEDLSRRAGRELRRLEAKRFDKTRRSNLPPLPHGDSPSTASDDNSRERDNPSLPL